MSDQVPCWFREYQKPFIKENNVMCRSGHLHNINMPAAGFVLVRLNAQSEVELLLDLRSHAVPHGNTWGLVGGTSNCINEDPLETAYREAKEEYGIDRHELALLGLQYKHDHGGVKFLTYTYIFAEYNPVNAPLPLSHECLRSQWFKLSELPANLLQYLQEDRAFLEHTLYTEIWPLLEARRSPQPSCNANSAPPSNANSAPSCNANSAPPDNANAAPSCNAAQQQQQQQCNNSLGNNAGQATVGVDGNSDMTSSRVTERVEYPKLPAPQGDDAVATDAPAPQGPVQSFFLRQYIPGGDPSPPTQDPTDDETTPAVAPNNGSGDSTKAAPLKPKMSVSERVNKRRPVPKRLAPRVTAAAPQPMRR